MLKMQDIPPQQFMLVNSSDLLPFSITSNATFGFAIELTKETHSFCNWVQKQSMQDQNSLNKIFFDSTSKPKLSYYVI